MFIAHHYFNDIHHLVPGETARLRRADPGDQCGVEPVQVDGQPDRSGQRGKVAVHFLLRLGPLQQPVQISGDAVVLGNGGGLVGVQRTNADLYQLVAFVPDAAHRACVVVNGAVIARPEIRVGVDLHDGAARGHPREHHLRCYRMLAA